MLFGPNHFAPIRNAKHEAWQHVFCPDFDCVNIMNPAAFQGNALCLNGHWQTVVSSRSDHRHSNWTPAAVTIIFWASLEFFLHQMVWSLLKWLTWQDVDKLAVTYFYWFSLSLSDLFQTVSKRGIPILSKVSDMEQWLGNTCVCNVCLKNLTQQQSESAQVGEAERFSDEEEGIVSFQNDSNI